VGLVVKYDSEVGLPHSQGPSMLGVVENKFKWNILIGKFAQTVRLLIRFRPGRATYFDTSDKLQRY
jgi:hypothetical protein